MKYLIMHGSYGSPDENWFRWLEKKLSDSGNEVILEQFPVDSWEEVNAIGIEKIDRYNPKESLKSWEEFFINKVFPTIDEETFRFVGHSIAPIFLLHMVSKYNLRIDRAIFVSPFFSIPDTKSVWQFYPVNKTFYSYDFDFEKITKSIDKSYVVYGDNDPYVPVNEPKLFAEKLGSEIIEIPGGYRCGSNFKEFPILLDLFNK